MCIFNIEAQKNEIDYIYYLWQIKKYIIKLNIFIVVSNIHIK